MLYRIVLACLLGSAALAPLQAAASRAEVETYATLLKQVIDREVTVVADRQLQAFKQMAGADSLAARILTLHHARIFSLSSTGERAQRLTALAAQLERELEPQAGTEGIPEALQGLIVRQPRDVVLSLINPIYRDMKPSMPVPNPDLLPAGFAARNEQRVRMLMEAVDKAVPYYVEKIKAYEPTLEQAFQASEWKDAEWEVIFEATRRRMQVVDIYYFTLLACNEVMARGAAFGLNEQLIAQIDSWLGEHMKMHSEDFETWDFNFGDYNFDFKHRLLVVRLEMARGHGIRFASPKEMMPYIEEMLGLDINQMFRGRQQKRHAQNLKMKFLDELMLWSMALKQSGAGAEDVERVQMTAVRFWKQFYRDLRRDLRASDDQIANQAANHFIMAARMFLSQGKDSEAMKLMSDILAVQDHPYIYNAKAWQDHLLTKGDAGGEVDWGAPIEPQDPETAISLAHSFRRAAKKKADPEAVRALRLRAAVALRNGIAGLREPEFAEKYHDFAPRVYQLYGYVLKELGWMEHATLAVQAGIQELRPLWGDMEKGFEGNPWGDPETEGGLDDAGQRVQRLFDDFYRYSGMLRRQIDNAANNDLYKLANEWRRTMNPNAQGGEKLEIITLIQDEQYQEAIDKAKGFAAQQSDLGEKIWFQKAVVQACYKWLDEENKAEFRDEDLVARISTIQDEEVASLERLIEGELEREEPMEAALGARALIIASQISARVREQDWLGIMDMLGADFWQRVTDRGTQASMINQLCNAAVKHRDQISRRFSQDPQPDPAVLLDFWPRYEHALDTLRMVEERFGQELTSNRKRMARVMNAVSKHSSWFLENIEKGAEGFGDISPEDFARLTRVAKASTINYVDLYVPTLPPDTPLSQWIAIGNDLWQIGAKQRALVFYEKYLEGVTARSDLKAYRENPAAEVDPVGKALLRARGSYQPQWDEIRDYLVDAPDLIDRMRRERSTEDLGEEKIDFFKALDRLEQLREQMERDRALLGNTDELFPQVDALLDTVKHLALSLQFKSRMAQTYMALGETARAVELSADLIAYDPLYPPYMTLFVEGVLMKGAEATDTELKEAQLLAAHVRNMTRERADMRLQYWTSACQVLELSILLGEIDLVQRTLQRYRINQDDPTADLRVRGTEPRQARDEGDVSIWKRFLRIYDAEGVSERKPFTIEENDDGVPVAVPAK